MAAGSGQSARAPLPPPDGLPVLPLPLAQPPLRLLGFVTLTDGTKVAVAVGRQRSGDGPRRRSTSPDAFVSPSIGEDAVELTDAVGERPVRLALP